MPFSAEIRCQKPIKKPIVVDNEKVHGVRTLRVRLFSALAVPPPLRLKRLLRAVHKGWRGQSEYITRGHTAQKQPPVSRREMQRSASAAQPWRNAPFHTVNGEAHGADDTAQ